MKKLLYLALTLISSGAYSQSEHIDVKFEEFQKKEFISQLPAGLKEFCTQNPKCNECYALIKMLYCAQNRPLSWELTKAEKAGDYKMQSIERFCEKKPWSAKNYPVQKGDSGTYYTYRNIYSIISDIPSSKKTWNRNSDIVDLLGKQFEEMAQKRVKDNAYFKDLVELLPDEIKKLCASQIHDSDAARLVSAFSDPFLYTTNYVTECVQEMAKNQQWAPETTIKYMEHSYRAFILRRTKTIEMALQFNGVLQPIKEFCKEAKIPLDATIGKLAYMIHYAIDGDMRNLHHALKKEFETHVSNK